jgi:hypothetical protein
VQAFSAASFFLPLHNRLRHLYRLARAVNKVKTQNFAKNNMQSKADLANGLHAKEMEMMQVCPPSLSFPLPM